MITSIAAFSMAIMITMVAAAFLFQYVITAIGYMGCMKKAGEATWKAWVPLYNDYIMYKIVGLKSFLIIFKIMYVVIASIYLCFTFAWAASITEKADEIINDTDVKSSSYYSSNSSINENRIHSSVSTTKSSSSYSGEDFLDEFGYGFVGMMIFSLLNTLLGIAVFVINILFAINISKAYGLGGGTIAGMILIPQIFILIIGYGKSQYQGTYKPEQTATTNL